MITLLVVRHGEAEGNREHRFIGQQDVPLTSRGRRQVEALRSRLATASISKVVTSDLQRAFDTVAPVAAQLDLEVETDRRWREIANGEWKGLLASEIEERWPELFSRYQAGEDVLRPGGECWADVQARVVQAVDDLVDQCGGDGTILIGTHAGPALALLRWAQRLPPAGSVFAGPLKDLGNTSVTTIRVPGPEVVAVNDVSHLDGFSPL